MGEPSLAFPPSRSSITAIFIPLVREDLKNEMKELQKETKELRSEPEKAMQVQKKAMETNMKYMMHSMKSTIFTILPIIIIFGWLNANLAYEPILPGQEFSVSATFAKGISGNISLYAPEGIEISGELTKPIEDGKVMWLLKGAEGDYTEGNALKFEFNGQNAYKDLIITQEQRYAPVMETIKNVGGLKAISTSNEKKKVITFFGKPISFLGFKGGWLGTYIIFSIISSMILRKVMKVY